MSRRSRKESRRNADSRRIRARRRKQVMLETLEAQIEIQAFGIFEEQR